MELVFTHDKSIIAYLIRYFTKRSWLKSAQTDHVALRYSGDENKWMVESMPQGFLPNWWTRFLKQHIVYRRFEVLGTDEALLEQIIDDFIDEFIGEKYDFLGATGMIIVLVWYWITGKKIKNPMHRKSELTCTEVVYKIFDKVREKTGITYFNQQDPNMIFPDELFDECIVKTNLFKDLGV